MQQHWDVAADVVVVGYDVLEAVRNPEQALSEGAPIVHAGWTSNFVAADRPC